MQELHDGTTLEELITRDVSEFLDGAGQDPEWRVEDLSYGPNRIWCVICETWTNGPMQYADHCIGKHHKKNLDKQVRAENTDRVPAPPAPIPRPPEAFSGGALAVTCDVCKRELNSPGQFRDHIQGKSHKKKVAEKEKAMLREFQ